MKKMICLCVIALVLMGATSVAKAATSLADMSPVELRLASAWPPPNVSLITTCHQMWMDEVTKRSNGKITFKTFWGGAMGKAPEHLSLLEKGVVDLVSANSHYTPGKLPLGQFEYVFPFGPCDSAIVTKAKRQLIDEFPEFARDLAKYNAVSILISPGTVYQFLAKTPAEHVQDFKGRKVGCIGRYFGRWMEPIGMVPVVSPAQERYTMLQTGVIDVDLHPVDLHASFKLIEQAKYLVRIDALQANFGDLWISKKTLDTFPPDVQKMLLDAGRDVEWKVATELLPQWTERVMKEFDAAGVKQVTLPEDERAAWAARIPDIPAEWAKEVSDQGYPGWDIVRRWQEITTELGYKWPRQWGVKK